MRLDAVLFSEPTHALAHHTVLSTFACDRRFHHKACARVVCCHTKLMLQGGIFFVYQEVVIYKTLFPYVL